MWETGRGDKFEVRMLKEIWQFVSTVKHLLVLDASSVSLFLEKAQWEASLLWTPGQAFSALGGDFGNRSPVALGNGWHSLEPHHYC